MSAAVLREAAQKMRSRAEAVVTECGITDADDAPWFEATDFYGGEVGPDPTHAHVASWHPAVALLVADLLDVLAQRVEDICETTPTVDFGESVALGHLPGYPDAIAVATAYLGGTR